MSQRKEALTVAHLLYPGVELCYLCVPVFQLFPEVFCHLIVLVLCSFKLGQQFSIFCQVNCQGVALIRCPRQMTSVGNRPLKSLRSYLAGRTCLQVLILNLDLRVWEAAHCSKVLYRGSASAFSSRSSICAKLPEKNWLK